VSSLTKTLIWIGVFAVIFGLLWWQGQIARIRDYIAETREELKKCTWPTWDELKGSTVLVSLSIILLGAFTVVIDNLLFQLFFKVL
jgi:preprotein translocase subunit SecE